MKSLNFAAVSIILLLVTSCAKFHRVTVRTNAEGHQVAHYENRNLRPIRDNNFNLIIDKTKAEKRLNDLGSFDALEKYTPRPCKVGVSESIKYHKAEKLLMEDKYSEAIALLDELKTECENIVFVSHINYLYGYAYEKQGEKEKAKKHIKLFIHKAESIYPQSFYQFDSPNEQVEIYEKYLSQANNYLNGNELVLKTKLEARYNTLEGTLLPGIHSVEDKNRIIFDIGYSSAIKSTFGIGYIFNTKYGQFIPFYLNNSLLGSFKSLLFKRQHFQTPDRKHTTGYQISIDEWKRYTLYRNNYTYTHKSEIHETGYGLTVGYGGTYQFNNSFSFVYSGKIRNSYETGTFASSMISYHTGGPGSILAGLYNNESVLMWKVGTIQIWYNYTDKSFNSSLTAGIRF